MAIHDAVATSLLDESRWAGLISSDGWIEAPATLPVTEPATGDVLGTAGVADAAAVARAAASAARNQRAWAATPFSERAAVMRRAAALLEAHHDEIAAWIVRESGSVPAKAGVELQLAGGELLEAATLPSRPSGQLLPSMDPGRTSLARRVPVGVVGVIAPWNFPVILAMRSVAPALALGNAVVLKSDVNTPVIGGVLLARLFEEAGLPSGVLHVFAGGPEVGAALVADPNVAMISFTGSTKVGRMVGETAGRLLKRVALELGGNNALIVLDDADVDAASSAGAWGSFLHQGQICMTAGRHLVHESLVEEYLAKLTERAERLPLGNPATDEVALGPLINAGQVGRVQGLVDASVRQGAAVLAGGQADGPGFPATVLRDVTRDMPVFREEIFGPVAPVTSFRDEDEAIALANDSEYGLTAAIQSGSAPRALALSAQLDVGMVHINDQTVNDEAWAPFTGLGASGNGISFGSPVNQDAFTEWQWVTSRSQASPFPF
jgi:benzaldehyde dehydrogenase (NAD)